MALTITEEFRSEIIRALRVNETATSIEEVTSLINAAVADLRRQGVDKIDLTDPLTAHAVKLYCKGHYGYDESSEKFLAAYVALSAGMALDDDYDEDGDES